MVEADASFIAALVHSDPCSSTVSVEASSTASNSVCGWNELIDSCQKCVLNRRAPSSTKRLDDRLHIYSYAKRRLNNAVKISLGSWCTYGNQVTCPVCSHIIALKFLEDDNEIVTSVLMHIRSHEGELDSSLKFPCGLCFNFCSNADGDKHCKHAHDGNYEGNGMSQVLCFTSTVRRYHSLLDLLPISEESSACGTISQFPKSSIFSSYSSRKPIAKCRAVWRKKYFCSRDLQFLLCFKNSDNQKLPVAWMCPLCPKFVTNSMCTLFHNDISLRFFILRHFAVEHNDLENINSVLRKEWGILLQEVGFNMEPHVLYTAKLLQQTQRGIYFYTIRSLNSNERESMVNEMVSRNKKHAMKSGICLNEYRICILCFKPVQKNFLDKHFLTDGHETLKAHMGLSEFREVSELSDKPMVTAENLPYISLHYSKISHVKEIGDCESIMFMKWRCVLQSDVCGHVDDVLDFPTIQMLKFHALKHFDMYHSEFYDREFIEYEWDLLQKEHPKANEIRLYSPLKYNFNNHPFDVTNPNHFVLPFKTKLLPKSLEEIQVCGFCFWCGYPSQFISHITCHGYVENGVLLANGFDKSFLATSQISPEFRLMDSEEVHIPFEILGRAGRDSLLQLQGRLSSESLAATCGEGNVFDCTAEPSGYDEVNGKPLPLADMVVKECPNDTLSYEAGSNIKLSKVNSPKSGSNTVPIGGSRHISSDRALLEGSESVVKNTCDSELTSTVGRSSTIPEITELECFGNRSNSNQHDVELHMLAVRKKFSWSGPPPPPLNAEQTKQLVRLSHNECPFCKDIRGVRGLRVPASSNDEIREECMIAHIVKFHYSDPAAVWVLNAKRYRISIDDGLDPLKFLLEPTEDGSLRCSSCERAAFPKMSNLRVHWASCIAVCGRYRDVLRNGRYVLFSPTSSTKTTKPRSVNEAVRCPLPKCISAWRPSFIYKNAVGQIAHMISCHIFDKQAYELAMDIGKNERLAEEFPYLHVSKSFVNSVEHPEVLSLQCAKCDCYFRKPNELVQHAKRYHPTKEHYSGSPRCPMLACSKKLRRRKNITDNLLQLLHVMSEHVLEDDAIEWISHWPEKFKSVMESEPVFKFDVLKSLRFSLEKGSAHMLCLWCRELFEFSKYLSHQKLDLCDNADRIKSLLEKKNVEVLYIQPLKRSKCCDSRESRKRSSTKCRFCLKVITINEKYSENISMFIHVLFAHSSDQEAIQFLNSRYPSVCANEFPYIDVLASTTLSTNLGKPTIECILCGFKTRTSRGIAFHARHHKQLMKNLGCYNDVCQCGESIRICQKAKESYQRLCHAIDKHRGDQEFIEQVIFSYEYDHAHVNERFLDVRRSLKLSETGRTNFACFFCEFSSYSSFALIHHSEIHQTREKKSCRNVAEDSSCMSESPVVCSFCNRSLLRSTQYSAKVTIMAHFLKFHRSSPKDVAAFVLKCKSWNLSFEFPYIDAVLSIKTGKLQCAVCEAAFRELCTMLKHARSAHESGGEGCSSRSEVVWKTPEASELSLCRVSSIDGTSQLHYNGEELVSVISSRFNETRECQPRAVVEPDDATQLQELRMLQSYQDTLQSWTSNSHQSIVPTQHTEMLSTHYPKSKSGVSVENNLEVALYNNLDRCKAVKVKALGISNKRTLFDELPQRIVKKVVEAHPPEDISHIEGVRGYPCNFCRFKARSVYDIRRHTSISHSEVLPPMNAKIISPCHHCAEVYKTRGQLLKHISDCHVDIANAFKCGFCSKVFATARGMREHERRCHESRLFLNPEQLICSYCNREFESKRNRDEHIKRHKDSNSSIGRGF